MMVEMKIRKTSLLSVYLYLLNEVDVIIRLIIALCVCVCLVLVVPIRRVVWRRSHWLLTCSRSWSNVWGVKDQRRNATQVSQRVFRSHR